MKRADELVFERGLAESRSKARALVEEGCVFCDGRCVDKPSRKLPDDAEISVSANAQTLKYVSRAGLKLEGFLEKFSVDVRGKDILDAGASTGGFTDCALAAGAKSSVCVDVGSNQLHPKIAADPRVINMEKTDIRSLTPANFGGKSFDFICADLSFISLEKVFGNIWGLLSEGGEAVLLVKPQFESAPKLMRLRGGVLKPEESLAALEKVLEFVEKSFPDAEIFGKMPSPIRGGDGNTEFLIGARKRKTAGGESAK